MNWKGTLVLLTATLLMMGFVVAQEGGDNPVESYFYGKILPFIQGLGTIAAIAFMIFGGTKMMKADDPAEVDKGKKMVIGAAIATAVIWLAPAIVNWLKPS